MSTTTSASMGLIYLVVLLIMMLLLKLSESPKFMELISLLNLPLLLFVKACYSLRVGDGPLALTAFS